MYMHYTTSPPILYFPPSPTPPPNLPNTTRRHKPTLILNVLGWDEK